MSLKSKIRIHLWTLPRWFATPFFGASVLLGVLLANGGLGDLNSWLAFLVGTLVMAGGHSFNGYLDYSWTGVDKGKIEDRSAEKVYTGACTVIPTGKASPRAVLINALCWYGLALIPAIILAFRVNWPILLVAFLGMLITFWYSKAKFNFTHELALATGVGPLSVLCGMFGVNPNPQWWVGIIASFPVAILLSFGGLALDEWPDAEANLKLGVKSISYEVWRLKISLPLYLIAWWVSVYVYQTFLITVGILAPLTGITFILLPPLIAATIMLESNFDKAAKFVVPLGALIPILMVVGQAIGR